MKSLPVFVVCALAFSCSPVRDLGVVSNAVKATSSDGRHPTNPQGLILNDGRALPTWDWIADSVR